MKQSSRRSRPTKSRAKPPARPDAPTEPNRRATLALLRNGAIGAAVLAGGGIFSVRAVRATVAEQDLSRVGKGVPTVVQIHDPACSLCTELQRQTRRALRSFDAGDLTYLVANITTTSGSTFARRHGAGHVTLILFDADGTPVQVLEGVRQRRDLEAIFAAHIARGS